MTPAKKAWRIVRESITVAVWATVLSGLGGVALESIEHTLLTVLPLLILLPALNDAIGNIGSVTSARFTSILYLTGETQNFWKVDAVKDLFRDVGVTALTVSVYIGVLSTGIAYLRGYAVNASIMGRVAVTAVGSTAVLFLIIFLSATIGGTYFYRKGKDPDNVLIPLTTSIADIGNLVVFSAFVALLF